MNIEQILTFIEVSETGSFSKAAALLFKTQPGVSRTVAALEKELGTQLLVREPHQKAELTESGQLYYDIFIRFRDDLIKAAEICRKNKSDQSTLRLGHAPYWNTSFFLPQVYQAIRTAETALDLLIECHEFGELSRRVYENYLDVAVTIENESIAAYNLNARLLCKLPKVIIYSKTLAGDDEKIDASFFADKEFLLYQHPYFTSQKRIIHSLEEELGFQPNVKSVVNVNSLNSQVMAGQGVVVLDQWSQPLSFLSLNYYPLKSVHNIVLIYRNDSRYLNIIDKLCDIFRAQKQTG
ncbi:MAG: LysR family transcriptional regulator [Mogibacterium sp.]|nr:LysR family transcriptional regulator [Mogibacterium sp.]